MGLLASASKIVPPLLSEFHKGQLGRVLVIGGSQDYTGAPFFAAMATALVGADMSHILCGNGAATVIKTYSPNLMVHPYLHDEGDRSKLSSSVEPLLGRMHALLIGPGLGRDDAMLAQVAEIIGLAKKRGLPLVIDADGLFLVQQQPELISSYDHGSQHVILTPNVVEFGRLKKSTGISNDLSQDDQVRELSLRLRATVLLKGAEDTISNGKDVYRNAITGSPRRVSGQGDTLSGTLVTFMAWTQAYRNKLWNTDPLPKDGPQDLAVLAAYAASCVARTASRLAFEKHGRSTLTTDVNGNVGVAFKELFEN